jgi:hypothetical protein
MKFWTETRGQPGKKPALYIKRLLTWRGFRLDLHKIAEADSEFCFHSHPARAIRFILWNGYVEECLPSQLYYLLNSDCPSLTIRWYPFQWGVVEPDFTHRLDSLPKGPSYSLWLRFPVTHHVWLRGEGWGDKQNTVSQLESDFKGDPHALK